MRRATKGMALALLLATVSTMAMGCGSGGLFSRIGGSLGGIFGANHANDYGQMHQRLDAASTRFTNARDEVTELTTERPPGAPADSAGPWRVRREGVITDPQWNIFHAGVTNVNTLNDAVMKDMDDWGKTGVRPAMLTPHVEALEKAQNDAIAIVRRVKQ